MVFLSVHVLPYEIAIAIAMLHRIHRPFVTCHNYQVWVLKESASEIFHRDAVNSSGELHAHQIPSKQGCSPEDLILQLQGNKLLYNTCSRSALMLTSF